MMTGLDLATCSYDKGFNSCPKTSIFASPEIEKYMVIYSVTVSVEEEIREEWLAYMKGKHLDDVMKTGCFKSYQMSRIIGTSEEKENSFNIQYYSESMKDLHRYQAHHAQALQKDHIEKFGEKAAAFRTVLETI